jgi:hypothetical protein
MKQKYEFNISGKESSFSNKKCHREKKFIVGIVFFKFSFFQMVNKQTFKNNKFEKHFITEITDDKLQFYY